MISLSQEVVALPHQLKTKTLDEIENAFSVRLPDRHRTAMQDKSDPIHRACEFLVPDGPGVLLPIFECNAWVRQHELYEWPDFLFAFASNGFGDYFAYDTRQSPYRIVYIDPDYTMDKNLASDEFVFDRFEDWHAYKCRQQAEIDAAKTPPHT